MARLVNTPSTETAPPGQQQAVLTAVAQRQYGRWAVQYRGANLAAAVQRDAQVRAGRRRLDALQEAATLRDQGAISDEEFERRKAAALQE